MHSDKLEQEIARVVQSVNEWDDRTSPDDYPEHLLITSEELADILRGFSSTVLAVENLKWSETSTGYWKAPSVAGRYSTFRLSQALGFDLRRDGESFREYYPTLAAAFAAAQSDFERRILSALGTTGTGGGE